MVSFRGNGRTWWSPAPVHVPIRLSARDAVVHITVACASRCQPWRYIVTGRHSNAMRHAAISIYSSYSQSVHSSVPEVESNQSLTGSIFPVVPRSRPEEPQWLRSYLRSLQAHMSLANEVVKAGKPVYVSGADFPFPPPCRSLISTGKCVPRFHICISRFQGISN